MWERLGILRGGFLTLIRAMDLGGFEKPDVIYEGIKKGEIKLYGEGLCDKEHPEANESWVLIDPKSFMRWLQKRAEINIKDFEKKCDNIFKEFDRVYFKLACIQHEINRMQAEIKSFRQLIFKNLIGIETVKSGGRKRSVKASA